MSADHVLYAVIAVVAVLGIVAFAARDRLSVLFIKWGNKSARLEAEKQSPGVDLESIDAVRDVKATDKTGKGVRAKKIIGRDITFTNEAPPKP